MKTILQPLFQFENSWS